MFAKKFSKIKKFCSLLLYLFLVFCHNKPIPAQELKFFKELAFEHSPLLKKQTYQITFSREKYLAKSLFTENPMLSLSYQNIPASSWPSFGRHVMSGISITLSQKLAFPWVDHYRKDVFRQKYLSEKEKLLDTKKSLILSIDSLFHTLHFFYQLEAIYKEIKETLHGIVNVARSLVAVNKMNSAQLLRIDADIAILENQILQTRAAIAKAQAEMENLCGVKITWNRNNPQNWLTRSREVKIPKNFQMDAHPLYKNALSRLQSKRSQTVLEKANLFPGITLSAGYTIRQEIQDRDLGEDFISLKASIPLPFYYPLKEAHVISAQEANSKFAFEEMKQVRLMLQTSWSGESMRSQDLLKAYASFETEVLPKYKASYQANLGALPSGEITLLNVLDSYRKYLDVLIKQAELFKELVLSLAKLRYLVSNAEDTK